MIDPQVQEQMRADWNERAGEDAKYYVAFGRRDQDDDEFFETAREVLAGLEWEMRRLPREGNPRARRALEIGCGPGRLIKPMSRHFGEIHGVDVSDRMIQMAREKLRGIPHAHVHATSGADLAQFADTSFDYIYSYAVFQHIPSKDVVLNYFTEMHRVLKPGGVVRCQVNGLPETARKYDTWSGVRFRADEIRDFTREYGLQLLALEGIDTQYLWTTWRKPDGSERAPAEPTRLRRVTNASNGQPVSQTLGRFASVTLWIENLPPLADLNAATVRIGSAEGTPCYIGPREDSPLQQLNVLLPLNQETGLLQVDARLHGTLLAGSRTIRVIPLGPLVPRNVIVTDGLNLLEKTRITSRTIKVSMEDVMYPESFTATVDGLPVIDMDRFCTDPRLPRYDFSFRIPEEIAAGPHVLEMKLGRRRFDPVPIEVVF